MGKHGVLNLINEFAEHEVTLPVEVKINWIWRADGEDVDDRTQTKGDGKSIC
jgi:hypothetical protein